jgi:hypothetical protein
LLAVMAVVSLGLSALPLVWAVPLTVLVLVSSAWRIRRDLRLAPVSLRIADDGAWVVLLQPQTRPLLLFAAEIGLRGPLAWVRAREPGGRIRAWLWWPDQIDPEGMRKLRLACGSPNAKSAPSLATMQG